jgi:hypothetical protein
MQDQYAQADNEPTPPEHTDASLRDGWRRSDLRAAFGNLLQLITRIAGVLPSISWLFGQAFLDDSVQRRRRHRRRWVQQSQTGLPAELSTELLCRCRIRSVLELFAARLLQGRSHMPAQRSKPAQIFPIKMSLRARAESCCKNSFYPLTSNRKSYR